MTTRHAALTARLVARFGGSATLTRASVVDGSPFAPVLGSTDYAVQLIETGAEATNRNGTLVETGDLVAAMLPHPEVSPKTGDRLTAGGVAYTVLRVEPVRSDPAGDVIHWRIEGRR